MIAAGVTVDDVSASVVTVDDESAATTASPESDPAIGSLVVVTADNISFDDIDGDDDNDLGDTAGVVNTCADTNDVSSSVCER